MITKPKSDEYHEFYQTYVSLVQDQEDIVNFLLTQRDSLVDLYQGLDANKLSYAYAESKWTMMQVLRHIIDTERIMGYRALCMARNDQTFIPGFEENEYIEQADDSGNNLQDLITEFIQVRNSNISMIQNFNEGVLERKGTVNGAPWTPRSGVYIMGGHVEHHLGVIKERYL
ncbi:MAG: DinB family protein [Reichenbachiella sp.]